MPCDSILRNEVSFSAGTDMELMKSALEDAGYNCYESGNGLVFNHKENWRLAGRFAFGLFTVNEGTDTDAIKRAYSGRSVQAAAKKMGWSVVKDKNNPLKMQLRKRV